MLMFITYSEPTPFILALGWTGLHAIWQILLLGGVINSLLYIYRKKSAKFKYLLSLSSLFLAFTWTLVTLVDTIQQFNNQQINPSNTIVSATKSLSLSPSSEALPKIYPLSNISSFSAQILTYFPYLVYCWIIGMTIRFLILLIGLIHINSIKQESREASIISWKEDMQFYCKKLKISEPVHLQISNKITAPLSFGYWQPTILFPAKLTCQLTSPQIRTILLHELAHIKRRDYLWNLLQLIIEGVLFFHPIIWWLTSLIRKERENCCDDIVLQHNTNLLTYTKTLTTIALFNNQIKTNISMYFSKTNTLLTRIKRLHNYSLPRKLSLREISVWMIFFGIALTTIACTKVPVSDFNQTTSIEWLTLATAEALHKQQPKPILVQVIGNDCKFDLNQTLSHPYISQYINKHFYPVQLDAYAASVHFKGQSYTNTNTTFFNELVLNWFGEEVVFPSLVFIDDELVDYQLIVGMQAPKQMEILLNYFADGSYQNKKWIAYKDNFVYNIK